MNNLWTVQWREYLEFDGVKQSIKDVKYKRKQQVQQYNVKGHTIEASIAKILGDAEQLTVKALPPQMDCGFGADLQVSYRDNGTNYSFFVDVTANGSKAERMKFFSASGDMVDDYNEAFRYETEYFGIRFGIKEKHMNWFFYEKPVIVLHIDSYLPCTGLLISHIHNIANILISLNDMLYRKGYGARASQKVRPNIRRFAREYRKHVVNSIED